MMEKGRTMISVIIPTYNRAKTLEKSIASVLSQTYYNIELIIVDDGSTDETREIINHIKDDRLIYVYQKNAGACAARNNGIIHAKGDYIAFHDSDDVCCPDRLEKQLNTLIQKKADMVCARTRGHIEGKTYIGPSTGASFLENINSLNGISATTFFAKSEVFKNIMFDLEMPRWQDLEFLIRTFSMYRIMLADYVVVDGFEQPDSISRNPHKCISAFELIMKKHPQIKIEQGELYYYLLKLYARSKAELDRRDCIDDFRMIYDRRKDFRSMVWYIAAKIGMAGKVFRFCNLKNNRL